MGIRCVLAWCRSLICGMLAGGTPPAPCLETQAPWRGHQGLKRGHGVTDPPPTPVPLAEPDAVEPAIPASAAPADEVEEVEAVPVPVPPPIAPPAVKPPICTPAPAPVPLPVPEPDAVEVAPAAAKPRAPAPADVVWVPLPVPPKLKVKAWAAPTIASEATAARRSFFIVSVPKCYGPNAQVIERPPPSTASFPSAWRWPPAGLLLPLRKDTHVLLDLRSTVRCDFPKCHWNATFARCPRRLSSRPCKRRS